MLGEAFFLFISVAGIVTASALYLLDERTGATLRTHIMKADLSKDGQENGHSGDFFTPQEVYTGTPPLGGSGGGPRSAERAGPSSLGRGYGSMGEIVV